MYFKSVTIIIVDLFDSLYCTIFEKRNNCLQMCSLKLKKVFIQICFVGWWKQSKLCLLTLLLNFAVLDIVENRLDYSSWIQHLIIIFERKSFGVSRKLYLPVKNGDKYIESSNTFLPPCILVSLYKFYFFHVSLMFVFNHLLISF